MTLQQFRQFIALAEASSVTKAAMKLNMAQPALSQALQRLEQEVGVRLMDRSKAGVALTPAGRVFLADAREALAAASRASIRARETAADQTRIRIGMVSGAVWAGGEEFLRIARRLEIPTDVVFGRTNEQLDALDRGELHFGFVAPPFEGRPRISVVPIANEPVMAAVPAGWCEEGPALIAALANALILFPRDTGPVLHDAILAMFGMAGLTPRIVQRSEQMLSTLSLVGIGLGGALVPPTVARAVAVTGVSFRPVRAANVPTWPIALVHPPLAARSRSADLLRAWRKGMRG